MRLLLALALLFTLYPRAHAYSVLTHEEVVDLAWLPQIVPLLKARYPGLTDDQLRTAHAYAYGGSVIQDIGYYPFGSHEFSDMVHYVRSGDFVAALIRDSSDPNELAFALGALAHYCGDVDGHPAVNDRRPPAEPQTPRQIRPHRHLRREPRRPRPHRVRLRRRRGRPRPLLAGQLPRLHRLPGRQAAHGASLPRNLRYSRRLPHEE